MDKSKNKYAKEAQRKELLGLGNTTTGAGKERLDYKKASMQTGRDIVIGGIGGGLAGTLIGRGSFIAGIIVAGVGHLINSPATSGFGIGLMASGGFQGAKGMNGTTDGIDGIKERFAHYKENIKQQFFLDKIPSAKKQKQETTENEEGTNGVGNVQYFKHPSSDDADLNGNAELDFSEANKLERQLEQSAKQFTERHNMSGNVSGMETEYMNGMEDDFSERIL